MSGASPLVSIFLLPCLLLPSSFLSGQHAPGSEAAIRERIREIHGLVPGLEADGVGRDWEGIPGQTQGTSEEAGSAGAGGARAGSSRPAEVPAADPSRDLVFASVVPTDTHLWILLKTAGTPSREDRAFWLNLDLTGDRRPEMQIGLSAGEDHHVRLFDGYREGRTFRSSAPVAAVGEVVEILLPLDSLAEMLGGSVNLSGPSSRSWVRVFPLTWDAGTGEFVDFGPAVASFRIRSGAYSLDPPLPEHEGPGAAVLLPLEGKWWIAQGPLSYSSHAGIWAYDLTAVDEAIQWASEPQGCDLADNYSWDRQVWSPVGGRILGVRRGEPDGSPCRNGEGDPNSVLLELGDGVGLWMAHFRQGSIVVDRRDRVRRGQYLGRVGNSGASSGPHLHLGLYDTRDQSTTLPMAFRDVRVGLNPGPEDPWVREMMEWEPREGFFVEGMGGIRG